MKSILIFSPPGFSPFVPTSAGPTLISYLKSKGIRADEIDLNSNFIAEISNNTFKNPFSIDNLIPFHNVALDFFNKVDLSTIYNKSTLELNISDLFELPNSYLSQNIINQLDNSIFDEFDVFGISITVSRQLYSALIIAQQIKQYNPNKKIVLGGSAISSLFEQILHTPEIFKYFDYIVKGDGSIPLIEILQDKPKSQIHSIAFLEQNKVYFNNLSKLPNDLYSYPPFYQEKYLKNYPKPLLLGIPTHVGCFYGKCAFCDYGTVSSYKYNYCGTSPIINIIEHFTNNFNVNGFYFTGAGMHPNDFENLANEINKRDLKIKWSAESLTVKFSEQNATAIKKSGCINLDFGLESASPKIRDFLNKGIKIETFHETLKTFRNIDFRASTINLILLHPIGNIHELDETLDFLKEYQDIIFHTHQSAKLDLRGYNEYYKTLHNFTETVVTARPDTLIRDFAYTTESNLLDYWLSKYKELKISGHFDWKKCADVSLIDHALYISHNSNELWEQMRKALKEMDNFNLSPEQIKSYNAW